MALLEVQQDGIGINFSIEVLDSNGDALDISSASTKQIIFKKPDGTTLTKTAAFVTNGSDGLIEYDTIAGDLSESGAWGIQALITTSSQSFKTEVGNFIVSCNL